MLQRDRVVWITFIAGLVCCLPERPAYAQLFGARTFGSSLQPQANAGGGAFGGPTPAPGLTPIPGSPGAGGNGPINAGGPANSTARFLRKNRTSADFVGKDVNKLGTGLDSQPAALGAVERRVPESLLNPPRPPLPRTRMYEPKLSLGFPVATRPTSEINASLDLQLKTLRQTDPSLQVTMTMEGETAHLEGQVGSEAERALIEQVLLFEPGISSVRNDLKVPSAVP